MIILFVSKAPIKSIVCLCYRKSTQAKRFISKQARTCREIISMERQLAVWCRPRMAIMDRSRRARSLLALNPPRSRIWTPAKYQTGRQAHPVASPREAAARFADRDPIPAATASESNRSLVVLVHRTSAQQRLITSANTKQPFYQHVIKYANHLNPFHLNKKPL